jgi:hypothetical protein
MGWVISAKNLYVKNDPMFLAAEIINEYSAEGPSDPLVKRRR